ncbi:class I SAM-dependent methyltransferase [Alkaliphilus hydrothermalis]|uniref:Ubiquinone/menaquinone biosynthesis C-methylase UbiE n=1 Tax=Alkaliphilus hydrothermalis TaxID=1482730 RepID=A0ABS2NSQ6_9FIRM|nr:class I SAM-dependent methyltransferase [Alkaliphilus hydrothermalis]MBM7615861.1 ubiquinone/menaquinone biosynthesis C-methylase UbiE [Alkaliphilus hydrothermalis]
MNSVVNHYEKYNECERLSTNSARKIEFIISSRILDNYITKNDRILDVAAGTGIYSFHYAEKGHDVFAMDLTPKHIQIIRDKLHSSIKDLNIQTEVNNAIDLNIVKEEEFDTVLCFGPIYHLVEAHDRRKCIDECLRVLKKGGILAIAYINKHYILPHLLSSSNRLPLTDSMIHKVIDEGVIRDGDSDCFWTDAFFTTPDDMEDFLKNFNVEIIDHVATDGLSPLLRNTIDEMEEAEYQKWIEYQLKTCREKSILGSSNHGLVVCKKK